MKKYWLKSFGISTMVIATPPATAEFRLDGEGLVGDFGKLQLRGHFGASVQGGVFDPVEAPDAGTEVDAAIDGMARLTIEYTSGSAWVFGAVANIDSGQEDIAEFERNEYYLYTASEYGRLEIGKNDGPADTLSFHAPRVGLGQVRGDFARYTGPVALLSAYDSRDAAKLTYLSPPVNGLRFGVSYAPEFEINADNPDPARRFIQENVIELGAQYIQPLGQFVVGVSGSYVIGESDPVTGRDDIQSWSAGFEIRRGKLTAGAAYVDRGKSNLSLSAPEESEWNAGISWKGEMWKLAGSVAIGDENDNTVSRYGVGAEYSLTENIYIAGDFVLLTEKGRFGDSRDGAVGLVETGVRF